MDIDNSLTPSPVLTSLSVQLKSDGLLLYVSQACYEPGTSPLSSWIPIMGYDDHDHDSTTSSDKPLDLFDRLVTQQLAAQCILHTAEADMDTET